MAGVEFNDRRTTNAITMRRKMPTTAPMMIFFFPAVPLPGAAGFAGDTGFGVSVRTGFSAAEEKVAFVFPAGPGSVADT